MNIPNPSRPHTAQTIVAQLATSFTSSQTIFWSGAGVSVDSPTKGPTGYDLTQRALQYGFAADTLSVIHDYYNELAIDRPYPRLETMLDVTQHVHGTLAVLALLSDLQIAAPNGNHHFFAQHLDSGGAHITGNFDTCIERSHDSRANGRANAKIIHFHGSLDAAPGDPPLGATLSAVQYGLPESVQTAITERLEARAPQLLVFVGYSGSDYFDVQPYFREIGRSIDLRNLTALWIDHQSTPTDALPAEATASRPILRSLSDAGASVHQVGFPTGEALDTFAASWKYPPRQASAAMPPTLWHAPPGVSQSSKGDATVRLFAVMGVHREVIDRLDRKIGHLALEDYEHLAHAHWAAGRYRDAERAWHLAAPGADLRSSLNRRERTGACCWLRGEYRRAEKLLRVAIDEAHSCVEIDAERRAILAETYGRVLTHMQRLPDVRLFVTAAKRRYALAHLPDPDSTDSRRIFGPHTLAKLASVRANLGAPVGETSLESSSEALGESEALNAQLNYRQAVLRHRVNIGQLVSASDYRRLHRDFTTIGATGDALRVMLLPGAQTAFSLSAVRRALSQVDFTRWHRTRVLAGHIAQRTVRKGRAMLPSAASTTAERRFQQPSAAQRLRRP